MEVIKKGNKNYIYYVRCEECGSIISFMKAELGWSHRLDCPICNSSVYTDILFHENDPYLGNEEVKKEVEEYLNSEDRQKSRAPMGKPAYVPKKKVEVSVDKSSDDLSKRINTGIIANGGDWGSTLEDLLKEVKVIADKVTYLMDDQEKNKVTSVKIVPYEGTKTNDWIAQNPYNVSITPL